MPGEEKAGVYRWKNIPEDPMMSRVNVHVYCAYRMTFDRAWTRPYVRNHYDRLYFVESGQALVETEKERVPLRAGHAYLIASNCRHRHSCPERVTLHWCHFQAMLDGVSDLFQELQVPMEVFPTPGKDYRETFQRLENAMEGRDAWHYLDRSAHLLRLLNPHVRRATIPSRELADGRRPFMPVLAYLDSHLHEDLRIDDLADRMGLNPQYFSRLFRRHFHEPPKRYILHRRIQRAQKLLCYTDLTVQEIGERCGVEDPYHFSKLFKQIAGIPPTEYRQTYRQ